MISNVLSIDTELTTEAPLVRDAHDSQVHAEMTRQVAVWMDEYLNKPDTCDELLHTGPASLEHELRSFLIAGSSEGSSVLVVPRKEIAPTAANLLEASNHTGLCGITLGVPLQGKRDKVITIAFSDCLPDALFVLCVPCCSCISCSFSDISRKPIEEFMQDFTASSHSSMPLAVFHY